VTPLIARKSAAGKAKQAIERRQRGDGGMMEMETLVRLTLALFFSRQPLRKSSSGQHEPS
jgi:hypothetical protein